MIEPMFGTAPPWLGTPFAPTWAGGGGPVASALAPPQQGVPLGIDPGGLARFNGPQPLVGGIASGLQTGYIVPALLATVAVRRGQPLGPTNDQELEDFIYDTLELLSGTSDVEARVDGGRVTLTGPVHGKRLKRDVGEIVWGIPIVTDVVNNVTIASRRRQRGQGRESEPQQMPARKQG